MLLLDSDAEIRDPHIVERHRQHFDLDPVFGARCSTTTRYGYSSDRRQIPKTGLLDERPWMPYVMLRSSHVCEALGAGASTARPPDLRSGLRPRASACPGFSPAPVYNFAGGPRSHVVSRCRRRSASGCERRGCPWLAWARRDYYGLRPNFVKYDTGTEIYKWLRLRARS